MDDQNESAGPASQKPGNSQPLNSKGPPEYPESSENSTEFLVKVWDWRAAIRISDLPAPAKLVLLNLSTYMNDDGRSCFPSTRQQALDTSLSRQTVETHLALAERAGFITRRSNSRSGQRWRNYSYEATIPKAGQSHKLVYENEAGLTVRPPPQKLAKEGAEAGQTDHAKLAKELGTNSSMNSSMNSPILSKEITTCIAERGAAGAAPAAMPPEATRKRGERLETFMAREHATTTLGHCPQAWGEAAKAAAHAYRPGARIDWGKEINWHFEKFYAHFSASSKGNAVKLDWRAAWLNWWKTEFERIARQLEIDEKRAAQRQRHVYA